MLDRRTGVSEVLGGPQTMLADCQLIKFDGRFEQINRLNSVERTAMNS